MTRKICLSLDLSLTCTLIRQSEPSEAEHYLQKLYELLVVSRHLEHEGQERAEHSRQHRHRYLCAAAAMARRIATASH